MSYRLIDANAIAIKYPEVNDMPCVFADLQGGLHGQFIEERKKGRWIDKGMEGSWNYCSVCGEQAIDLYDYCPNCGADMRGEENG